MFPQKQHFRLTLPAVLLAVVFAAFPVTGYCVAAGRADFVVGNVVAVAADGKPRALVKGSEINSGESINTSAGARAQIRFTDGAYVSLQPNTQFRVDDYNYENKTDGKEKGFFSLLKGGLRTITGAIGHVNRDRYRVATPSATIGIRGTGYNASLSDGLFVNVGEGEISLTNNAGVLLVKAGDAAFVANINTMPTPAFQQPATPPASFEPLVVTSPLAPPVLIPVVPEPSAEPSSSYALSYAYNGYNINRDGYFFDISSATSVTPTFSSPGELTQYVGGGESGAKGTAGVSSFDTDGIVSWGRWDHGTTTTAGTSSAVHPLEMVEPNEAFHYVTGIPTPNMPTTGTAYYNLLGATTPSAQDGGSWSLSSGSLSANFGTQQVSVSLNVQNNDNVDQSYSVISAPATISGATFAASGMSASGCMNGCNASVNGAFYGNNAARAGLAYQINDVNVRSVQGVAAFTKNINTTAP